MRLTNALFSENIIELQKIEKAYNMKNEVYTICIDKETGGISQLILNKDADQMNWVKPTESFNNSDKVGWTRPPQTFGVLSYCRNVKYFGLTADFQLDKIEENENHATAYYSTKQWQTRSRDGDENDTYPELTAKTEYCFNEDGNLAVKTVIKNVSGWQKFFLEGDIGVNFNFFDDYHDAATCMTSRCTAHLWSGEDSTWICGLKMGESPHNVGLVFTQGGTTSYSQNGCRGNDRGYFAMNLNIKMLRPSAEYMFSHIIFSHTGKEDFMCKIAEIPHCAAIYSDNFTYFQGEKIRLTLENATSGRISASSDLPLLSSAKKGNKTEFEFSADILGEHKITFTYGEKGECKTFSKVFVSESLETVITRRLNFIVDKQQYNEVGNALDGAFLCYDTESCRQFYDEQFSDMNAQRERLGMTIMLARYLQAHNNEKLRVALEKAVAFVRREVYDAEQGEVFNFAGKYSVWLRLYNFPWVSLLLTEVYPVFKDKTMLSDAYKIMKAYYERGGLDFYPNGIFARDLIEAFEANDLQEESEKLRKYFLVHVQRIIDRGVNYPKHEVNYEQTIVTPAVSFILDAYFLTKDKKYLEAVQPHLAVLERFDGLQPHYMLNNIAVRYWDDRWFGKLHVHGDTLPHYWSSLSSIDYIKYFAASGDENRLRRGICGLRNCLSLFMRDGSASCARLFPFEVNGLQGERFDPLCNDQDFALYFAYKYLDKKSAED